MQSALRKILIRIRILVFGVMQIDKINIVVISFRSGDGLNRKEMSPATKASKSLLLMLNVSNEIGTLVQRMDFAATPEKVAIQLRHDQIIRRFRRQIVIQNRRVFSGCNGPDIAITRRTTSVTRRLCATATIGTTIGTTKATRGIAPSRTCR